MSTELITRNAAAPAPVFKDKRLTAAAAELISLYEKEGASFKEASLNAAAAVDTFNRKAAEILGKVAAEKSYEKDGFKDVKDFAVRGLSFDARKVYTLIAAGRVYNDKEAPEALKKLSPANYEAIKAVGYDALKAAAAEGTDFASMTQKELKEYAASHKADKKPSKPRVLPTYDAHIYGSSRTFYGLLQADLELTIRNELSPDKPDEVECLSIPSYEEELPLLSGALPQKVKVTRFLYIGNGRTLVLELRPHDAARANAEKLKAAEKAKEADMFRAMVKNGLAPEKAAEILGMSEEEAAAAMPDSSPAPAPDK